MNDSTMSLTFTSNSLYSERNFYNAIPFLLGVLALWFYRTWRKQAHIPGPFLASISNIPRFSRARGKKRVKDQAANSVRNRA